MSKVDPTGSQTPKSTGSRRSSNYAGYSALLYDVGEHVQNTLPSWAFQRNIFVYVGVDGEEASRKEDLKSEFQEVTLQSLKYHLRPAIPWLRAALLVSLITILSMFAFIYFLIQCPDQTGIPAYPWKIYVMTIPMVAIHNLAEIQALKVFLTPYLAMVYLYLDTEENAPFKVLGITTNFTVWLVFHVILSNLAVADSLTDTAFAASYMKALQCPENQGMRDLWIATFRQSMFGKVGIPVIGLYVIIGIFWLIWLPQMLIPLITLMPKDSTDNDKESITCAGRKNYSEVFDELVEGNTSATLQSVAHISVLAQLKRMEDKETNDGKKGHSASNQVKKAATPVSTMASRMWCNYIFESVAQVNIQSTLFMIAMKLSGKHISNAEFQTLLSLSLSLILTALKFVVVINFRKVIWQSSEATALAEEDPPTNFDPVRQAQLKKSIRWYYLAIPVMVWGLAYAIFKLIAAFECEDSMWNISGCVQISTDEAPKH